MARTDTLVHYLTDVADMIRSKTGESGTISADAFDTKINQLANPSEYFDNTAVGSGSDGDGAWMKAVKKIPKLTYNTSYGSFSLAYVYMGFKGTQIDLSGMPIVHNVSTGLDYYQSPSSLKGTFKNCSNLTSLDTSYLNTERTTTMEEMFYNCKALTTLNLSNFDTSQLTNTTSMFMWCTHLTTLDLSGFTYTRLTDANDMFKFCYELTTINFGNNTFGPFNMKNLFNFCEKLNHLDLRNFNVLSRDLDYMFSGCKALNDLNITGWDVSHTNSFKGMFATCESLTRLDLSSWNTSYVQEYGFDQMFMGCSNLEWLDISGFVKNAITHIPQGMFYGCTKLMYLDMSGFSFVNSLGYNYRTFDGVPANCLIYVKNQTAKDYLATNYPELTNVQIKS